MKQNVLLVEDNEKAREMLVKILGEIDEVSIHVLEAENIDLAYRYAVQYTIDLFLLDIIIDTSVSGDTSGMKFAAHIRNMNQYKSTPIIFVTSLVDQELFAYSELHCYQYLEKPYDAEKALVKIREALGLKVEKENDKRIFFRKNGLILPVLIRNIVYIECSKPFMKVVMINDALKLGYHPMNKILQELDSSDFLQCNRNTIINVNHIESIDLINRFLKMKPEGTLVDIGEVYEKAFMSELKNG